MVELAVRLLSVGAVILLAGVLGWPGFDVVWQTGAFVCAYGFLGYWLDGRGRTNAGVAGLLACADSIAIAALLASQSSLSQFGFLVLAPVAYAAAKHGSLPSAMAPIAAFALLGADQWSNQGAPPTPIVLGHALGVLAVGLLLNHRRIVVSVAKPVLPEWKEPLETVEPDGFAELRENYRKLKDLYESLERRSRRDRHVNELRGCLAGDAVRFPRRLAAQLKTLSGASSLALYTVAEQANSFVIRAVEGASGEAMRSSILRVGLQEAAGSLQQQAERAMATLLDEEDGTLFRNVVLTHRGRMVGLVCLRDESRHALDEAAETVGELAPLAAELIAEANGRHCAESRLKRAELLYEVGCAATGAGSRNALAARVVAQLAEMVDAEYLSVSWIADGELYPAATQGPALKPLDAMSFAQGPGLLGWLRVGAPEIAAADVAEDARCVRAEMNRLRLQSLVLAPIGWAEEPLGYLFLGSPRAGAIGVETVEAARMVAAELFQAATRTETAALGEGMMLPGELQRLIAGKPGGSLVYLQPAKREETDETFGRPTVELALRQLALRLRAKLPAGGALCRRPEGDFVAYLPDWEDAAARAWASEASAIASSIGIWVDQDGKRVPIPLRAKVAPVGSETEPMTAA
jgi:GGDEF domain-containing protein